MALGDLHIFTGEEYVDTELAPLLNENFNSLKEYVDDASRIKTYSQLSQIGITPGQETFASIHNALPINSVLEYYAYPNSKFNDEFYPVTNYYGVLQAVKLNDTKTVFSFYAHNVISGNEFSELYLSAYHSSFADTTVWKKVALDSDLTNLSNSVVKSVNGIKPNINGNVTIDIPEPVIASEAEAKAGTNNTKFMTPLRMAQASAKSIDTKGINPGNYYYRLPDGLQICMGVVNLSNSAYEGQVGPFNFAAAFTYAPNVVVCMVNADSNSPQSYDSAVQVRSISTTNFYLYQQIIANDPWFSIASYIAIGRWK